MHAWATKASKYDLGLGLSTATLVGLLAAALTQWLSAFWTVAASALLALGVGAVWTYARAQSRDIGLCVVAWPGQGALNPHQLAQALSRSTRSWIPIEATPPETERTSWLERLAGQLAVTIDSVFQRSVGDPRLMVAMSTKDAIAFLLGVQVAPYLMHADVDVMRPPTKDIKDWAVEILVSPRDRVEVFTSESALVGGRCSCIDMRGVAVVHPANCPVALGATGVAEALLQQGAVCCNEAILIMAIDRSSTAPDTRAVVHAALHARSRAARILPTSLPVDLFLVCGADVAFSLGLLLSSLVQFRPWVVGKDESGKAEWQPWI